MAYCTLDDVQAEFKNTTFSGSTLVTDENVTAFIVQADAVINSYVGKRYETPVPETADGFQILKMISSGIVAERVRAILEVKQVTNKDGEQNVRRGLSLNFLMGMLKDISTGKLLLDGALSASNSTGIYSENSKNYIEPEFKKGSTQW
jgi:phage gp36-like protein